MQPYTWWRCCVPDLLLLSMLLMLLARSSAETVSACFNNTQKSLPINCGSGYMLRITKAFYGYSYAGACEFRPGDCTQAEHEAYPCVGQDSCSINLPSGNYGQRIPDCDKYSTYFQVEYQCEPVIKTIDVCRAGVLTAQSGYLSTPRYPGNYQSNSDCITRISVHESQKINLTIIDMDLEISGTYMYKCHDWLYAFNRDRSVTLCGRRGNERLTTLASNEISIRFQSDQLGNRKGFWLYYEAYPPLPTLAPRTTSRPTVIHRTQAPTTPPHNPTIPVSRTTQKINVRSPESLPFAAIVGGVIGTLTFILIVLLVLLYMKWRREKKETVYTRGGKDIEYLDARNPAFRSSSGSEFQGMEIYYNC